MEERLCAVCGSKETCSGCGFACEEHRYYNRFWLDDEPLCYECHIAFAFHGRNARGRSCRSCSDLATNTVIMYGSQAVSVCRFHNKIMQSHSSRWGAGSGPMAT